MKPSETSPGKARYLQLADRLRDRIRRTSESDRTPLGTLSDVAAAEGVRTTVAERALNLLAKEGWVRRSREGIYRPDSPRTPLGAFLKWDPAGLHLESHDPIVVRVLSKVTTSLPRELMKVFEVHGVDGARASRIVKLHRTEHLPLALETLTSPMLELPGLLMKDHRTSNLYSLIVRDYGLEIDSVEQKIHQRILKDEEAKTLGAAPNFPALCLDRLIRTATHAIAMVEWVIPAGRCRVSEEAFRI